MTLALLRPVGEPVCGVRKNVPATNWGPDYLTTYLRTGTEALALALKFLREKSGLRNGNVIIPAYACPSLVSAAVYADVRPVLVDLDRNSPFVSADTLEATVDSQTLAVISYHFLGVRDDIEQKQEICSRNSTTLIEDSAQLFPGESLSARNAAFVILSFGRGKPVCALGGGALLARGSDLSDGFSKFIEGTETTQVGRGLKSTLLRSAYNLCIRDLPFGLLNRLPGLAIGETNYRECTKIVAASDELSNRIDSAITNRLGAVTESQLALRQFFSGFGAPRIVDLAIRHERSPLLRYPVLVENRETRDRLYCELRAHGIGASKMYGLPLNQIPGVSDKLQQANRAKFPNAIDFSARLLTLPVHTGVTSRHIRKIKDVIRKFLV